MSIQKILEDNISCGDDLNEQTFEVEHKITGIPDAAKEIEGMKCINCKHLKESHEGYEIVQYCAVMEIDHIWDARKLTCVKSWEATK